MAPAVSIITIVKNGERSIERTIKSVLSQEIANFQYIVIDGGSTDGTVEIINRYIDFVDVFVSEPDSGTSEAFNKGLAHVRADYLIWLAADDCLGTGFLQHALERIKSEDADLFWGSMVMYSSTGMRFRETRPEH